MIYCYYPGCTLKTKAKNLDEYGRFVLSEFGIELSEISDWQCCGGAFTSANDEIATKLSSIRALAAAKANNSPLVTLCSACFNVLKQVNYQFNTDFAFAQKANNYLCDGTQGGGEGVAHGGTQGGGEDVAHDGTQGGGDVAHGGTQGEFYNGETEVLHYLEVLRDKVGFDAIAKKVAENPKNPLKGKKIGAYYGCLLLRPSKVMQFDNAENPKIIEELIKAVGAVPVVYPMRNECCGSYAVIEDKSIANKKSALIVESGQKAGAEMLITACPLCLYNLQNCSVECGDYSGAKCDGVTHGTMSVADINPDKRDCGTERSQKLAIHYFTTVLAASLGNEKASAELGLL